MVRRLNVRTFSGRLILSTVLLILMTTLSAGLPAYWLTRSELKRQAWSHVASARQATASLLDAEQAQAAGVVTLLSERPTLQRLLREGDAPELTDYLQTFQQRSGNDHIFLCGYQGQALDPSLLLDPCPPTGTPQYRLFAGQPALVATRPVFDDRGGEPLGQVVLINWLDRPFLQQLAASTGVEQSILLADGTRLVSSLRADPAAIQFQPMTTPITPTHGDDAIMMVAGQQYYATTFPLMAEEAAEALQIEVALPADQLLATERRALSILATSTSLVALFAIGLGATYLRRLIRPLRHLTQMAQQISHGDLTTPVPTFAEPAEVATLAAALQKSQARMLQALNDHASAREWLDTLIQAVIEGIITFDSEGRVTFLNQKAALLTPLAEEAIGHHINELFPVAEEGSATFLDLLPRPGHKAQITIGSETRLSGSNRMARLNNRFGYTAPRRIGNQPLQKKTVLEVTTTLVGGANGEGKQTALVLRDISEEQLLRNLRSYFLANITHEFRTPLSTFTASIELLMNEAEELSVTEMRGLLKPVHLSLLSLQTLVDNLLESSSIEAGRFVLRKRAVVLNQLIAHALQMVQPLLERRRQSISLVEPARLPSLSADGPRLTQVLINLLTNASKYSPIGETIDLLVEEQPQFLRITIADRGPGVPSTELTTLFQNFVRANNHAEDQYGVGLGLYVVKTTIEAHHGRVGVNARPGGGSLFWVELPVTEAAVSVKGSGKSCGS